MVGQWVHFFNCINATKKRLVKYRLKRIDKGSQCSAQLSRRQNITMGVTITCYTFSERAQFSTFGDMCITRIYQEL